MSRYRYNSFGNRVAVGGEGYASPLGWQGRELDSETGFYYFCGRYYASKLGRFISEDPVGLEKGRNLFVFPGNDPVNTSDPFGLQGVRCDSGGFCGSIEPVVAVAERGRNFTGIWYFGFVYDLYMGVGGSGAIGFAFSRELGVGVYLRGEGGQA